MERKRLVVWAPNTEWVLILAIILTALITAIVILVPPVRSVVFATTDCPEHRTLVTWSQILADHANCPGLLEAPDRDGQTHRIWAAPKAKDLPADNVGSYWVSNTKENPDQMAEEFYSAKCEHRPGLRTIISFIEGKTFLRKCPKPVVEVVEPEKPCPSELTFVFWGEIVEDYGHCPGSLEDYDDMSDTFHIWTAERAIDLPGDRSLSGTYKVSFAQDSHKRMAEDSLNAYCSYYTSESVRLSIGDRPLDVVNCVQIAGGPCSGQRYSLKANPQPNKPLTAWVQLCVAESQHMITRCMDWGDGSEPVCVGEDRGLYLFEHTYDLQGTYQIAFTDAQCTWEITDDNTRIFLCPSGTKDLVGPAYVTVTNDQ